MSDNEGLEEETPSSRRRFVERAGAAAALVLSAPLLPASASARAPSRHRRPGEAAGVRIRAAKRQRRLAESLPRQERNRDEAYPDLRGSFHKCLPQSRFGEVDVDAFRQLQRALRTGRPADFARIPLSSLATRRLANPQGALTFNLTGADSHATRMRAAPAFGSAETAAEMVEVYWHALLRDTPFADYESDPLIETCLRDLNRLSAPVGPTEGGRITARTLFRGETPGDLVGPYVSQFLWKEVPFGLARIDQRYRVPLAVDFMTSRRDWLRIQRGVAPRGSIAYDDIPRYIYNARSLGEYVHVDVLSQAYQFAGLIALAYGADAFGIFTYEGNPSQAGFTSLGGPDFLDNLWHVGNLALRAAWYQKWSVHRRLRPEVFAARVHFTAEGRRTYDVHPDVLGSRAVRRLQRQNGNAFLPLAFPEGSPTHPSYPAGHAAVAGACCTVLKAFLNEDFVIPDPVVASRDGRSLLPYRGPDLTLRNEINKLASNISLGRDLAGVHYRSDGIDGILVGEQVALSHLADVSRTYNENFEGFTLTTFDGSRVLIAGGCVYDI
ncbi:MAG: vanadium-dependent haloperoxidase [Myxococcota bacterium]